MKQELAMRVLSDIMDWNNEQAQKEFTWLQLMAHFKYDSYGDYVAGARFIESLADWLQQFDPTERPYAYAFVRKHLVFISAAEVQHLVHLCYPETVRRRLLECIAAKFGIPAYRILSHPQAEYEYSRLLRKTLFLGLSDGARIDVFRRANNEIISNEQVVLATEINRQKWKRLLEDLRDKLKDNTARFEFVFLLDDFLGTGKTLIRKDEGQWKGRLPRFWETVKDLISSQFEDQLVLYVHHYLATERAARTVPERHSEMVNDLRHGRSWLAKVFGRMCWFANVRFTFGMKLPEDICVRKETHPEFFALAQKYYDRSIETRHTEVGGEDVRLGFGQSALPLVVEHNTPNNSVALLWADTKGEKGAPMRPLFRRRQRHSA